MKIGMPTFFEYDNLEDNLKFGKKHNIDFIELNMNYPYINKLILEKPNKLKELLDKYQIEATIHFYDEADFGLEETSDVYLNLLKRTIENSLVLNVKQITIHLNLGRVVTLDGIKHYIYETELNDFINRLKKNLKEIEKYSKKYNVNVSIENVISNPWILKVYDELNSTKFTYDIGHDYMSNSELYNFFSKSNSITEFHIHDSNGQTDHLPLGQGNIDLKKYINLITNQYVLIEVKSTKSFENSLDYLDSLKIVD